MIKSKRLEKINDLIPRSNCVIDVGCDHGYLEELLIKSGKVKKVIATDISSKSLQKTEVRAKKLNILDKIELICCDGLRFKGQSKSNLAIIAGIGGIETVDIIKNNTIKEVDEFILLPVQNAVYVRDYLIKNNYKIIHDETIFEKGKFYSLIYCKKSDRSNWDNKYFGLTDLKERGEDFQKFVERELKNLKFLDNPKLFGKNLFEKQEYRKMLLKIKGE